METMSTQVWYVLGVASIPMILLVLYVFQKSEEAKRKEQIERAIRHERLREFNRRRRRR